MRCILTSYSPATVAFVLDDAIIYEMVAGLLGSISHKTSYTRRQDAWKAMKGFLGRFDPLVINEPICRKYRARRKAGDATAPYELMQLLTALGWASTTGQIIRRPAIWLPQGQERKRRHLTFAKFDRFYAEVRADHARLYVALGLDMLARQSAIFDLTWGRADFMRRLIDFTRQGHVPTAERRIIAPINDDLLVALQTGTTPAPASM